MKTEDLIPDEFFKQFKTEEELPKVYPKAWHRENARGSVRCTFRL